MNIKNKHERILYLTLLSDLILSKFSKEDNALISLVDMGNFVVVKGKTKSTNVIDLHEITENFKEKLGHNFENMNLNTIDIIEYNTELSDMSIKNYQKFSV